MFNVWRSAMAFQNLKTLRKHIFQLGIPWTSFLRHNICTLKNKITCRSVKSIFSEHEVKNTMFFLKEDFVIVPIDKAANNVVFICKHFYALTIIKVILCHQ